MLAILVSMVGVWPVFMTGAFAVEIKMAMTMGNGAVGLAMSAFFLTTGLGSIYLSRVVGAIGAQRGVALAAALAVMALIGIALSRRWGHICAALVVAGCANAVSQPAANVYLMRGIRPGRRGVAFGLKQAAIPAATLTAGAAVPVFGILLGWRWAFVGAALCVPLIMIIVARVGGLQKSGMAGPSVVMGARHRRRRRSGARPGMILLAAAGGLGSAAAVPLGTFLVLSAVNSGLSATAGALLLVLAGGAGLVARVSFGWFADRYPGRNQFVVIAILMSVGAVGFAGLASGQVSLLAASTLLGFGAGWGWTGLFHYAVLLHHDAAPAEATGIIQSGLSLGAAVGPLMFGLITDHEGYQLAWLVSSFCAALAALFVVIGRNLVGAPEQMEV